MTVLGKSLIQPDGGGSKQSREASRQARATNGSGNDVAVWQLGIGDGAWGGGRPTKVGYRKRMG